MKRATTRLTTRRSSAGPGELCVRLASLFVLCVACDPGSSAEFPAGEVGIFYGGQVQRLQRIELPAVNPPEFGFRVHFPDAEAVENEGPWEVQWQVVRPGPLGRRVKQIDEAEIPREQERLDQVISIPLEGGHGTYNVRVTVDGQLVIDRAVVVRPER